ncbi:transcriptional repressor [bacterium]|nr:transcriptional repressor [bacterium]
MMDFVEILKNAGIAASQQRMMILKYLDANRIHPTTDQVFQALRSDMPTLSKTTVYNTLKKLVEHKVLVELSLFENEARYEYDREPHIHLKCTECNEIIDLDKKFDLYTDTFIAGHKITEHQINLKGICKKCLSTGE